MVRLSALAAALLVALSPAPAWAKPAMWVIRDADSTIILFGSVHILKGGTDWEPPELKAALAKADDVWFEIPFDEAGQLAAQQAAMSKGLLPRGQKLSALLNGKDRARLAKICARYGLPPSTLEPFQPWLAEQVLTQVVLQSQGADLGSGVEQTLQQQAPARVERRAFETAEAQIGMIAGVSRKAQLASLKDTLKDLDGDPGQFSELVAQWMSGDTKALYHDVVGELKEASPELYEVLVKRRNRAWVPQIEDRLKGHGTTVMVVGAGHLIGPDSVPALLRAKGITVEGP